MKDNWPEDKIVYPMDNFKFTCTGCSTELGKNTIKRYFQKHSSSDNMVCPSCGICYPVGVYHYGLSAREISVRFTDEKIKPEILSKDSL